MASAYMTALPELLLLGLICLLLVADTFIPEQKKRITAYMSGFSLLLVIFSLVSAYPESQTIVFAGTYVLDPLAAMLKVIICSMTLLVYFYAEDYLNEHGWLSGEFFILGLFCVLGMLILASAASFLTIYLGLELMSLSLYAMIAMHRQYYDSAESAMKYFILGAIASGLLLYGISIIYGITGHINLNQVAISLTSQSEASSLLIFGLIFILAGLLFKLGAAPFHMWVPDIYQGAPTAVTLFISSVPKVAAFAMAFRILNDGLISLLDNWQSILVLLSVISMALGNIIAIAQSNIKRMLAYSTIAHVGFIMLGLLSVNTGGTGYADALFYVITYGLMTCGIFGLIILMGRKEAEADQLDDYRGLSERNPWFALMLLMFMFSLAGIPPFIGFWAKWMVIMEVIESGYAWLAAVAVLFSIIGAYYYLRVIKLVYFDKPEELYAIKATRPMRVVLSANGLALLVLGIAPGALMNLCLQLF